MAADTTTTTPPPPTPASSLSSSPPPPAPAAPRQRLSGFEQMHARVKELTSSQQAELLERIQKLKQEAQSWRSDVEAQVKACQSELQGLNKGLATEMEQLRTELEEVRSAAIQEQKGNRPTRSTNSDTVTLLERIHLSHVGLFRGAIANKDVCLFCRATTAGHKQGRSKTNY